MTDEVRIEESTETAALIMQISCFECIDFFSNACNIRGATKKSTISLMLEKYCLICGNVIIMFCPI